MQIDQSKLRTYLNDHLAGANFAIQLLEDLKEQTLDAAIAHLAANLLPRILKDRDLLESTINTDDEAQGSIIKNVAGWAAQKLAKFKLSMAEELGVYEAVELLNLGVQGKKALWKALQVLNYKSLPLNELITEVDSQIMLLENERLRYAQEIFRQNET